MTKAMYASERFTYEWVEGKARRMIEEMLPGVDGMNAYPGMPFAFRKLVDNIWNSFNILPNLMYDVALVVIRNYVRVFIISWNVAITEKPIRQ